MRGGSFNFFVLVLVLLIKLRRLRFGSLLKEVLLRGLMWVLQPVIHLFLIALFSFGSSSLFLLHLQDMRRWLTASVFR